MKNGRLNKTISNFIATSLCKIMRKLAPGTYLVINLFFEASEESKQNHRNQKLLFI